MKKVICLLIMLTCTAQTVFSNDLCPNSYELTSGWSRFISRASGSNFIHTTILEHYLEKQAKKELGGKFDIKIDSFSTKDLKSGKFKSLNAVGEKLKIEDVSISKATITSICPFNQLDKSNNSTIKFITDFPANITMELSADDINKVTETTDYKKAINEINDILRGMLNVESINFDIKDNKLWYNFVLSTPFSPKKQTVSIGTNLNLQNNNIHAETAASSARPTVLSILNMLDALNFINPLDFSTKILENNIVNANLQDVYIQDNKVIVKAFINIKK